MRSINVTLESWNSMGIHTPDAARQEHESHLREAGRSAAGSTAPSGQGGFIKHNYTQDDYKRMVVNLDDEEDN